MGTPAPDEMPDSTGELRQALGVPDLPDDALQLALTHRSYAYEHGGLPTNERLEFLGDAVLGLVVAQVFNRRLDTRLAALAVPTDVLRLLADQRVKLAGAEIPNSVAGSLRSAIEQAIDQSYIDSFRLTMLIAAGLALASAIAAAAMIQNQPQGEWF